MRLSLLLALIPTAVLALPLNPGVISPASNLQVARDTISKPQDPRIVGGAKPGSEVLESDVSQISTDTIPVDGAYKTPYIKRSSPGAAFQNVKRAEPEAEAAVAVTFHRDQDPRVVGGVTKGDAILSTDTSVVTLEHTQVEAQPNNAALEAQV